jgi:hypothetical protein
MADALCVHVAHACGDIAKNAHDWPPSLWHVLRFKEAAVYGAPKAPAIAKLLRTTKVISNI